MEAMAQSKFIELKWLFIMRFPIRNGDFPTLNYQRVSEMGVYTGKSAVNEEHIGISPAKLEIEATQMVFFDGNIVGK